MDDTSQLIKTADNQKPSPVQTGGAISKEKEAITFSPSPLKEVKEVEISKEAKEEGVVQRQEEIEIPEEIAKIGVAKTGISVAVSYEPTLKLPISDERIEQGRHQSILTSFRWLSQWCIFQLKKAHLLLKVIHGKVKRVRDK